MRSKGRFPPDNFRLDTQLDQRARQTSELGIRKSNPECGRTCCAEPAFLGEFDMGEFDIAPC
jgi:hypothetical protein